MDTLDIVFMPKQIASQLVIALALETSMVCEQSNSRCRIYVDYSSDTAMLVSHLISVCVIVLKLSSWFCLIYLSFRVLLRGNGDRVVTFCPGHCQPIMANTPIHSVLNIDAFTPHSAAEGSANNGLNTGRVDGPSGANR